MRNKRKGRKDILVFEKRASSDATFGFMKGRNMVLFTRSFFHVQKEQHTKCV